MTLEMIPRLPYGEKTDRDYYGLNIMISGPFGVYEHEKRKGQEPMRNYWGLGDTKGVEGFFVAREDLISQNMGMAQMRVQITNSKRMPRIFAVQLTKSQARHMRDLVENKQYCRAMKYLMENPTYKVIKGSRIDDEEMFEMILNLNAKREREEFLLKGTGILNYQSI
jgi:hypothetical protein